MKLNVLYTFDDAYAPFATVSIHSLLKACTDIPQIDIYCIGVHVSEHNKKLLRDEVASASGIEATLHLIDGQPIVEKIKALSIPTYRNSHAPNLRLFFEEVLPPDATTVLYLDCDTIITGSLRELISADYQNAPAAVVRESICADYYKRIGLGDDHRYFNSGVVLFLPEWRNGNYTKRLLDFMQSSPVFTMNPDQDYLNLLLQDSLYLLPPKYNFQPVHVAFGEKDYFRYYPRTPYYTAQEIASSREDVRILHTYRFCGQFPWHDKSIHPCAARWLQNKNESICRDLPPVPNKKLVFKIERLLYKLLPHRIFLKVFTVFHKWYSNKQHKEALKQRERSERA